MSFLTPATNHVSYPGLPFLGTNIERYIVHGGGATVFQLLQGDAVEVLDTEGLQRCELILFNEEGQIIKDVIEIDLNESHSQTNGA